MRTPSDRGIAMITVLMVMTLISALLIGFTAMTMGDQRMRFIDRDRTQAFYAASAGLEKLTADLGNLFLVYVAPTAAQISALTNTAPAIPNTTFMKSDYTTGYQISAAPPSTTNISTGPYSGLYALTTLYTMNVNARTTTGGESHLRREIQTVAIPVFQFGIFSDVDLSFFAGPNFNFGGRVHTNGNLFLAEGNGNQLTLADKVTAVKEVIRQRLQNGVSIDTSPHLGSVHVATATGACAVITNAACRALARTEGSVVDGVNSALNDPTWTNVSLSTYNGWIRNGRTGARTLNLPVITMGGTNTDIVRRPLVNENVDNAVLYGERYYGRASLRILLSDTAADITGLPGIITATPPVQLDGNWNAAVPNNGTAYGPIDATHPPIATTATVINATTNANTPNGTATRIAVAAIPAGFKIPATIAVGPNPLVVCTGRTPTTFTGCTIDPTAMLNGAAVTGIVATGAGNITVSTTLTAAAATNAATLTVASTAAFAPTTFYLNGTLVSCGGYDTTPRFINCVNVPTTTQPATIRSTNALSTAGTGTIGGFIKAELQKADGTWIDVTMELLNYGIAGPNPAYATAGPPIFNNVACNDPTPNAILRIQRLKDNGGTCDYNTAVTGGNNSNDFWPNVLFDPREGLYRDCGTVAGAGNCNVSGPLVLGGVMHYITLDVRNLSLWLRGTAPYGAGQGLNAISNSGYTVYFSDRRNNRDAAAKETGEYGFEDFVNPASGTGAPNGTVEAGEDVNANSTLDAYGQIPNYNGVVGAVPPGAALPLNATARTTTQLTYQQAQVNRAILFRHALKLTNGGLGNIVMPGLTIVSENPVYIQGDWNMNAAVPVAGDGHAATSVLADAVTLLSGNWNDDKSFAYPYNAGNRTRNAQNYYRVAIIGGKGMSFPQPASTAADFGTDGGAHNFLRYLESGGTLNYEGSIATFFYNRQAVGTYKCCTTVYSPPVRNYFFDIDFLDPAKLPPLTPVFRDLNTIGFSQEIRPGR